MHTKRISINEVEGRKKLFVPELSESSYFDHAAVISCYRTFIRVHVRQVFTGGKHTRKLLFCLIRVNLFMFWEFLPKYKEFSPWTPAIILRSAIHYLIHMKQNFLVSLPSVNSRPNLFILNLLYIKLYLVLLIQRIVVFMEFNLAVESAILIQLFLISWNSLLREAMQNSNCASNQERVGCSLRLFILGKVVA